MRDWWDDSCKSIGPRWVFGGGDGGRERWAGENAAECGIVRRRSASDVVLLWLFSSLGMDS